MSLFYETFLGTLHRPSLGFTLPKPKLTMMTSLPEKMKQDTEMVENLKFHIMRNKTHILVSVLFPLETTSAAKINPFVACRHLFKLHFLFFKKTPFTWPELLMFWNSARNIAFSTTPKKITPPVNRGRVKD